jgi:hypothetical protein
VAAATTTCIASRPAIIATGAVRPVVERTYAMDEAADAHRHSETGRVRGTLAIVANPILAGLRAGTGEAQGRANLAARAPM